MVSFSSCRSYVCCVWYAIRVITTITVAHIVDISCDAYLFVFVHSRHSIDEERNGNFGVFTWNRKKSVRPEEIVRKIIFWVAWLNFNIKTININNNRIVEINHNLSNEKMAIVNHEGGFYPFAPPPFLVLLPSRQVKPPFVSTEDKPRIP